MPKFSIVTIHYNHSEGMIATGSSVLSQTYTDYEWIIIDGGSRSEQLNKIDKFTARADQFISEQDRGVYDAMNKGIKRATGEWTIFMNSGDEFASPAVLEAFRAPANASLVYGDAYFPHNNRHVYVQAKNLNQLKYGICFSHQALFTRTECLKEFHFDEKYNITADFDNYQKILKKYPSAHALNYAVARIEAGGLSEKNEKQRIKQKKEVIRKYHGYLLSLI